MLEQQARGIAFLDFCGDTLGRTLGIKELPCGSADKESAFNAGDLGLIPGSGRSPGEGKGYPLQYSRLKNSMDCIVHGVAKNRTRLNDFHFTLDIKIRLNSTSSYELLFCTDFVQTLQGMT